MKKTFVLSALVISILVSMTSVSSADNFSFKLLANRSAIDSGLDAVIHVKDSNLVTGISGVYNENDYKILFAKAMVKNELFIDGLQGMIGFKGAWGEAEKHQRKGDMLNIAFSLSVAYDLSTVYSKQVPVTLSAGVSFSPQPLCFQDTDEFFETLAEIDWKVLENAALVARYRYIEINFDERTRWEKTDSTGYLGLKFSF